ERAGLLAAEPGVVEIPGGLAPVVRPLVDRARQIAGRELEDQAALRVVATIDHSPSERLGGRAPGIVAGPPAIERRLKHDAHAARLARVDRGEELSVGGEDIAALPGPRRVGPAAIVPLLGDVPEEDSLVVLSSLQHGAVFRHGNELLAGEADHRRVAEGLRTAGHAVVSRTPERAAVHRPEEDRLALLRGQPARLAQIGPPGDRPPVRLPGSRPDERQELPEVRVAAHAWHR